MYDRESLYADELELPPGIWKTWEAKGITDTAIFFK